MRKSKEKTSHRATTNDIILNPNEHSWYVRVRHQEYFHNFIKIKSAILLIFFLIIDCFTIAVLTYPFPSLCQLTSRC